ncbi:MAG: helix-turn-helix domain-containing protein [Myxococcota bacterium]
MDLDPDVVARELIRALRGRRSQTAMARRLGYKSNAVYTWESGRRSPPASVFLQAAGRLGIDVAAGLRTFLREDPPWLGEVATPAGIAALLTDLRGDAPIGRVAERAGRSRFAVSRWLSGRSEPRLPDLLRMVDATSLRALEFVAVFVDPATLSSTRTAWERLEAARTLAWSSPWAQAVLLGLELAPYRAAPAHDPALLAAKLGLEPEEVEGALALLERAGQVARDGAHWAPVAVQAVDVRRSDAGRASKAFWATVALDRLRQGAPGAWSYNVFTVSEADLAKLEEMNRAHYRAVRALIAASSPAERVALIQLQLVPLG